MFTTSQKAVYIIAGMICVSLTAGDRHPQQRNNRYAMQQQVVDLNQVKDFFEVRALLANLPAFKDEKVPLQLPLIFAADEPDIRAILAVLPQQNIQVPVIEVGDVQVRSMCTKRLSDQMSRIWFQSFQKCHKYTPNWEQQQTGFFDDALDTIIRAQVSNGFMAQLQHQQQQQ